MTEISPPRKRQAQRKQVFLAQGRAASQMAQIASTLIDPAKLKSRL